MTVAMWGTIGGAITLILLILKTFFSADAKNQADDAQAAKDEAAREAAQTAAVQSTQAAAAHDSAGTAQADDAADAIMREGITK